MQLSWLVVREDWDTALRSVESAPSKEQAQLLRGLANSRMGFSQLLRLDRSFQSALRLSQGGLAGLEPVRLALLGSATTSHLPAGIRVAGLRRGLAIEVYETPYGMYGQELSDPESALHIFRPEVVLVALDAHHVAGIEGTTPEAALDLMRCCWRRAREAFACQILQQTVLPVFAELIGNNESRLLHSPAAVVAQVNTLLRPAAELAGVDLLAIDRFAAVEGLRAWHDAGLWHRSKHEVHPRAAESYGEQVVRMVAAARGQSAKCLVLDLDNTLWGGMIGDDGLEGIELGQGTGMGEAFVDFQRYVRHLSERGVILAVCSKNDKRNALEPFLKHPEMALELDHIACFVANWCDKATNLRDIARTLNIGLDSLVFVDDSAAERELVRRELPMVAVPEMPEDPALYSETIAATGYFEAVRVTREDLARADMYQANAERERLQGKVTDMASYLESLKMVLSLQPFERVDLARVTQLINKTNQFNLTTERLSEAEVTERCDDPCVVTLQARLRDRFGDNGIIAVLIARHRGSEAVIESWLMSCRVLGRRVEEACLNALAESCLAHGIETLTGIYSPTPKNGMVREMYRNLGFELIGEDASGATRWQMSLKGFTPSSVPMRVESVQPALV